MKAYKGFDKDLKCRGFQYEIGGEYETDEAKVCKAGFHACEYPLDVLGYYPPNTSRYCEVEQGGKISQDDGDSKTASTKIRIGAELNIAGLVKAAIKYTRERCTPENSDHATGDQGAASATGNQGAASATGYQGAASATGNQGAASATGNRGVASATGNQGAASATDYQGAASATGNQGAASATGDQGAASATGIGCVALAAGRDGRAMGALGCAICVCERGPWDGQTYPLIGIRAAIVDGETIKPGVWYKLVDGEFAEVEDREE